MGQALNQLRDQNVLDFINARIEKDISFTLIALDIEDEFGIEICPETLSTYRYILKKEGFNIITQKIGRPIKINSRIGRFITKRYLEGAGCKSIASEIIDNYSTPISYGCVYSWAKERGLTRGNRNEN